MRLHVCFKIVCCCFSTPMYKLVHLPGKKCLRQLNLVLNTTAEFDEVLG